MEMQILRVIQIIYSSAVGVETTLHAGSDSHILLLTNTIAGRAATYLAKVLECRILPSDAFVSEQVRGTNLD